MSPGGAKALLGALSFVAVVALGYSSAKACTRIALTSAQLEAQANEFAANGPDRLFDDAEWVAVMQATPSPLSSADHLDQPEFGGPAKVRLRPIEILKGHPRPLTVYALELSNRSPASGAPTELDRLGDAIRSNAARRGDLSTAEAVLDTETGGSQDLREYDSAACKNSPLLVSGLKGDLYLAFGSGAKILDSSRAFELLLDSEDPWLVRIRDVAGITSPNTLPIRRFPWRMIALAGLTTAGVGLIALMRRRLRAVSPAD